MKKKTAILVPVEDIPKHILEREMQSVFHQTKKADDIIVVDNSSELLECKEYLDTLSNCKVYLLDEKLDSMGKVLNYALSKTDAKYITGIHNGDFLDQRFIELLTIVLDRVPNTQGVSSWTNIFIDWYLLAHTSARSIPMLRRNAIDELGGFVEDVDLPWTDVGANIGIYKMSLVKFPLYNWVYWDGAKYKESNLISTLLKDKSKEGERVDLLFPNFFKKMADYYLVSKGNPEVRDKSGGTLVVIEPQMCVRAVKETMVVRKYFNKAYGIICSPYLSHNINSMQKRIFDEFYSVDDIDGFHNLLRKLKPDIIHSHNSPDGMVVWANEIKNELGCRVIHDVHDIGSITFPNYWLDDEKNAMENSDAIICVSDEQLEYLNEKYELPSQTTVIKSYINERYIPKTTDSLRYPPKIVYEGHLGSNTHRDLYDLFINIIMQRLHLHVHPVSNTSLIKFDKIKNEFFHIYGVMTCEEFWNHLGNYDVGIVALNKEGVNRRMVKDSSMFKQMLPNKLMEYVSFGIVPVVIGDIEPSKEFVTEHGIGLTFDDVPIFMDIIDDLKKCKERLNRIHMNFTMESQVDKLLDIYNI